MLSLNGLGVLDGGGQRGRSAIEVFRVESSFGPTFTWDKVVADLHLALAGRLAIRFRLADRVRTYGDRRPSAGRRRARGAVRPPRPTTPRWSRCTPPMGWRAVPHHQRYDLDLDIVGAKVQTLGPQVVDSFFVRSSDGAKVADPAILTEIERPCSTLAAPVRPIRPAHESGPGGRRRAGQCSWETSPCSSTPANRPAARHDDPHVHHRRGDDHRTALALAVDRHAHQLEAVLEAQVLVDVPARQPADVGGDVPL